MKKLFLAILLLATPALAQDQPVHILDTGRNSGVMTYIAPDGQIKSQPVIIDGTFEDAAPAGRNPLIDPPPLGTTGLDD